MPPIKDQAAPEDRQALAARLIAHADLHAVNSPHDAEQAELERALREAARLLSLPAVTITDDWLVRLADDIEGTDETDGEWFTTFTEAELRSFAKAVIAKAGAIDDPRARAAIEAMSRMKDRAMEAHRLCNEARLRHPDIDTLGDDGELHKAIHAIVGVATPDYVEAAAPSAQIGTITAAGEPVAAAETTTVPPPGSREWMDLFFQAFGPVGIVALAYTLACRHGHAIREAGGAMPILWIMGDAGCGKSTLLSVLAWVAGCARGFPNATQATMGAIMCMLRRENARTLPLVMESLPDLGMDRIMELSRTYAANTLCTVGSMSGVNDVPSPGGVIVVSERMEIRGGSRIGLNTLHAHVSTWHMPHRKVLEQHLFTMLMKSDAVPVHAHHAALFANVSKGLKQRTPESVGGSVPDAIVSAFAMMLAPNLSCVYAKELQQYLSRGIPQNLKFD